MKRSYIVLFVFSALIVSGLTNCTSTKKLMVNANEIGRYDFSKIKSDPEYEKLEERLRIGGPFTFYYYVKGKKYFVTKIEELMPIEEYNTLVAERAAIEAQKKAEQAAAEESKRKALEEANKYDPTKFTIVPSDFKPADYKPIDLFTAVANVEKMPRGNGSFIDAILGTQLYVSDVVFVTQNGTDIQFRTADNAISQIMKVNSRSGLTAGQRVRLYYVVSKNPLTEWRVRAIERL